MDMLGIEQSSMFDNDVFEKEHREYKEYLELIAELESHGCSKCTDSVKSCDGCSGWENEEYEELVDTIDNCTTEYDSPGEEDSDFYNEYNQDVLEREQLSN